MSKKSTKVDKALQRMEEALGSEKVRTDDFTRAACSSDGMPVHRPGMANGVVYPSSVEEVQAVVKIANEFKAPLIPQGGRVSSWRMLDVPAEGAILVDLVKMRRIIEIDEENLSATVEAGCTVFQVDKVLRERGFRLAVHPTAQPGGITIGAEMSKNSIGAYGGALGPVERWVHGIKVVLGNGDILETGTSRMLGTTPNFERYGLPDLTGFIMGSEGGLGIVVEATYRLNKVPAVIKSIDFEFPHIEVNEPVMKAAHEIRQYPFVFGMYWTDPWGCSWRERAFYALKNMTPEERDEKKVLIDDFGDFPVEKYGDVLSVVFDSYVSEEEAELKRKKLVEIGEKYGGKDMGEVFAAFSPDIIPPLENQYGPRTMFIELDHALRLNWYYWWIHVPFPQAAKAMKLCQDTYTMTKLPPSRFYTEFYFTSTAAAFDPYPHYKAADPREGEEIKKWGKVYLEHVVKNPELTTVPGQIGRILREEMVSRIKPTCAEYIKKMKMMFDPNCIMNPGVNVWPTDY